MTVYRRPLQQPEKAEQQHIVQLLRAIGCQVYVLGTHRRRGDYHGTMQTPGLPDVMAFLPARREAGGASALARQLLVVEAKAPGGRLRPDQKTFRSCCIDAEVAHVVGGLDAVIAWLIGQAYLRMDQVPHYRLPASTTVATEAG